MRISLILSTTLGLLCLGLATSCGKKKPAAPDATKSPPPREVQITTVTQHPLERTIQVVGTLSAREAATIAAQVAGQLEQTLVDLGDHVSAHQALALIDTTAYEALAAATAANLARAQASASNAAQNLNRIQALQRDRIASTSDLDAANAEAARTRAEVKVAEANHAVARLNLDRSRVKAPFAGTIAERIATAGDYLAVGSPIVRLVQTDPLRLRLEIPERESASIQPGQTVRITLEGDAKIHPGQITRIAPALRESTRMLLVEADVPNPDGLRAGLFARATIVLAKDELTPCLPSAAIITFAGLEKVVLFKNGAAAEQPITTGRRNGDWVEILSGLTGTESVVLNPSGLRTGQPLTLTTTNR